MRPLVLAFDRVMTLADTRQERHLAKLTGSMPQVSDLPVVPSVQRLVSIAQQQGRRVFVIADSAELVQAGVHSAGSTANLVVSDSSTGLARLASLRQVIGDVAFDFIGHDLSDSPIFHAATEAWVVDQRPEALPPDIREKALHLSGRSATGAFHAAWQALRPHHWVKNFLVFLSIVAAHRWADSTALSGGILAFVVFSMVSSSVYLTNDVFDLADDRRHPHKRQRPLAAGTIGVYHALALSAVLCLVALGFAALLGTSLDLLGAAVLYVFLALAYSRFLKTIPYVELFCLGGLYTMRVIAGGWAAGVSVSVWLLALCLCLFTSLAAAKRAAELTLAQTAGVRGISRRRYSLLDLRPVSWVGVLAAAGAAMVMIIYAREEATAALYAHPMALILATGWLMLWVVRIWLKSLGGSLSSDPILFALKDFPSWTCAAALAATIRLGIG